MIALILATIFMWFMTVLSLLSGDGWLVVSLIPLAIGMTFVIWKAREETLLPGLKSPEITIDSIYSLPDQFRILSVGEGFVDFEHPEGGSWGHGISEDIRSVNGVEMVESLGRWRYRLHVNRNSMNAAQVLEAAYHFRIEPKVAKDGIVDLNSCSGFGILYQEAINDLD